jgi:cellulose synthase/poly-beta-1,6-N-acetylglucosamine synthase-like glycosyltransferase
MILDPVLGFLAQLDRWSLFHVFWFLIILEIPRYTLAFLAVAVTHTAEALRPKAPAPAWRSRPTISIVIAGHNESEAMRKCLRSLAEQTIKADEIIAVDDGSTDGMRKVLADLRRDGLIDMSICNQVRCGKAASVNLAIAYATGDIIINVDADCSFDRDAIERLVEQFNDPRIGAVSGNLAARNAYDTVVASYQGVEYLISISTGKRAMDAIDMVACASGAFSAFRRAALAQIGVNDVGPGEDFDMTIRLQRAGWAVRFAHESWCWTDVPATLAALVRQRRRWDRDTIRIRLRKFRNAFNPFLPNFSIMHTLEQIDFLVLNLVVTVAFPFYLGWLFYVYGTVAWYILAAVTVVYMIFDMIAFLLAVFVSRQYAMIRLWPFALSYGMFNAYVMRFVRLYAYFEEWVLRASYRDSYVPQRVLDRSPVF